MDDERPLLIGLVRVSTDRQGDSGLGLEAQQAAIERYRAELGAELVDVYQEIESGKHNDISKRPRLREAAEHAVEIGATLVIGKLDRLVRSTSVLQYLRDTGVKFVACDNPHANKMTVTILAAVAEHEAEMIGTRTREALAAYKAGRRVSRRLRLLHPDGVPPAIAEATAGKLGASLPQCRNLTPDGRAVGRTRSLATRRARADKAAATIARLVRVIREANPEVTMEGIARILNERKRRTPRGKPWTGKQVALALARAGQIASTHAT